MPNIELRRVDRTNPQSTHLRGFSRNVTSQYGEDGIIERVFQLIGCRNSWCVEFGAWDGRYLSNTWDLVNNKSWKGVLLEGDDVRCEALRLSHLDRQGEVFVKQALVGWEGDNSLDELLKKTPIPLDFDLLSIDIDGNDWHVWHALTHYRPRLVVIEFNPSATNELYFVQDPDPQLNQGASLLAFIDLAKQKGYELAATTNANAFFVTKESFPELGISDNDIDSMYAPYMDIQLCQGFDGTIFAAGHMWLNWHAIKLSQDDLQVLPRSMRYYPDPGVCSQSGEK